MIYQLRKPDHNLRGAVTPGSSKSISNRVLIINALSEHPAPISNLADAKDTRVLESLLSQRDVHTYDAGPAGTTFRFMTAYLALQDQESILTGSERMLQRPIGPLVAALRTLGARIDYLGQEGFPPLRIRGPLRRQAASQVVVPASISSQFVSALLLIAPLLPEGLEVELSGTVVSEPYIDMTLSLMETFGAGHEREGDLLRVPPQAYRPLPFRVEGDWSAASYFYAMAALAGEADIQLNGLQEASCQGDAAIAGMMQDLGVTSTFSEQGVRLRREGPSKALFERDFLRNPDLVQTLAVACGGLGVQGLFSGLETLHSKETDRVKALQQALSRVGVHFTRLPARFSGKSGKQFYLLEGKAVWNEPPVFHTYDDHRMALSLAPLAMLGPIGIRDPQVVEKSYPRFWDDLRQLGFEIT